MHVRPLIDRYPGYSICILFFGLLSPFAQEIIAQEDLKKETTNTSQEKMHRPVVIVAEHVALYKGKIITWEDLLKEFRNLKKSAAVRPSFYFSNGAHRTDQWKLWRKRTQEVYPEIFQPQGMTLGGLNPRMGKYYDRIRNPKDLEPDPAKKIRVEVRRPDGKICETAQVFLLPLKDNMPVAIEDRQLRNPINERLASSQGMGSYLLYPDEKDFMICVLDRLHGFRLIKSDASKKSILITLNSWSRIDIALDATYDPMFCSFSFSFHPQGGFINGIAFQIYEVKSVKAKPGNKLSLLVPPGTVNLQRTFPNRSGSISVPSQKFEIAPGKSHPLKIGAPTPEEIKKSVETRRILETFRKPG